MNEKDEEKAQRVCRQLVEREVVHCCSRMIYELAQKEGFCEDEDLLNLCRGVPDYEEACVDEGWVAKDDDSGFANAGTGETCGAGDWQELADERRIEPYEWEIYEHWIVTPWFSRKLAEHGETVGELFDFHIWGRATTGQSICMDGIIRKIASEMEILPGQKNDWSKE